MAAPFVPAAFDLRRPVDSAARQRRWSLLASGAAMALATFSVIVAILLDGAGVGGARGVISVGFGAATVAGVTAIGLAVSSVGVGPRDSSGILAAVVLAATGLFMTAMGAFAVFLSTVSFARGRQLRRRGRVLLPDIVGSDAWSSADTPSLFPDLDVQTRRALAAQWRENARTEHASVAAFARLTLDLIALGAPPALLRSAQDDALDEIRHTELCFDIARSIDGRAEGPAPFPAATTARTLPSSRPIALAMLAVDSLVDGALHEGVSARIIAKLARRCGDARVAATMKVIAADEGRHCRHGWDVVQFCLEEGGAPVAHALAGALRTLPVRMASPLPLAARTGAWERFGIMGEALESAEYERARSELVRRVTALITPFVTTFRASAA